MIVATRLGSVAACNTAGTVRTTRRFTPGSAHAAVDD